MSFLQLWSIYTRHYMVVTTTFENSNVAVCVARRAPISNGGKSSSEGSRDSSVAGDGWIETGLGSANSNLRLIAYRKKLKKLILWLWSHYLHLEKLLQQSPTPWQEASNPYKPTKQNQPRVTLNSFKAWYDISLYIFPIRKDLENDDIFLHTLITVIL